MFMKNWSPMCVKYVKKDLIIQTATTGILQRCPGSALQDPKKLR